MKIIKKIIIFFGGAALFIGLICAFLSYQWTQSLKSVYDPLWLFLIFVAIVMLILIPLGFMMANIIIRPLEKLRKGAERIGSGDLETSISIDTGDEFEELGNAFNWMAKNLKNTTTSIDNLNKEIFKCEKAEKETLESRNTLLNDKIKMERIVASMTEGVIMLDEKGRIAIINPQARYLLGFGPGENIETGLFYDRIRMLKLYDLIEKCRAENNLAAVEIKSPEDHILRCEINPVGQADKKQTGILIILRDITKEKEIDRMKSDFISTVSHELRTPLSITKEGISLIIDNIPGKINRKQQKILTMANDNIDRLSRLISDLLDISKLEAGKIEIKRSPIDTVEVIKDVVSGFENLAAAKGLELRTTIPHETVEIYADHDRIKQVFTNLLENAIKFTDIGHIEVACLDKPGQVECSVRDTGRGVSKDDMAKLFLKFQQFNRAYGAGEKGTGLGLSISKSIIEMHKGKIWAESEIGRGTKFIFVLPKITAEDALNECLTSAIQNAPKKDGTLSVMRISVRDFEKTKAEIAKEKIGPFLNGAETVVTRSLREESDKIIIGKGEFFVILAGCDRQRASRVKERIEENLRAHAASEKLDAVIKFDIGFSAYPDDGKTSAELIEKIR